jgi:hypothetical protein
VYKKPMIRLTGKTKLPYMLSVRLDEETSNALKEVAEEEERAEGQLARLLIKEALAARGKLKGKGKK